MNTDGLGIQALTVSVHAGDNQADAVDPEALSLLFPASLTLSLNVKHYFCVWTRLLRE